VTINKHCISFIGIITVDATLWGHVASSGKRARVGERENTENTENIRGAETVLRRGRDEGRRRKGREGSTGIV